MLEKYLRKGIDFKRAEETLNVGIKLVKQANEEKSDSTQNVVEQTKEKVKELISGYNKIYTSSSLWAVKQTILMQELRQKMGAKELKFDEPEKANDMQFGCS